MKNSEKFEATGSIGNSVSRVLPCGLHLTENIVNEGDRVAEDPEL